MLAGSFAREDRFMLVSCRILEESCCFEVERGRAGGAGGVGGGGGGGGGAGGGEGCLAHTGGLEMCGRGSAVVFDPSVEDVVGGGDGSGGGGGGGNCCGGGGSGICCGGNVGGGG